MTGMTRMAVALFLALLMWDVSDSSTWDYRFHGNNKASSRAINGTSSSSRTLYSEGGEMILQDTKRVGSAQNTAMNTSSTNFTQATMPVVSEGGGSDQVYFEDKNTTNQSRIHAFGGEETDDTSNSTHYTGGDSEHKDSTELQTLSSINESRSSAKNEISKEINSRTSSAQQSSTALAAVGRSLEEHHPESPGPRSDAVSSYYDFLVNEGSYKFWSVFQVFTAALLIYSAFAAVYYAKYTFATMDYPDYLDDGFFFRRAGTDRAQRDDVYYDYEDEDTVTTPRPQQSTFLGMSSATFQRIMDALSSKKYS